MKKRNALRILAASALVAALVAPAASAQPSTAYLAPSPVKFGGGGHVGGGIHAGIGVQLGKHTKVYGSVGSKYGPIGVKHGHIGFGQPHCKPQPYHAPQWVPGRWVTEVQRVWVPAKNVQVWVEPVYQTKCDYFGNSYPVLVAPGHYETVCEPGHWTSKRVRAWQPGRWA